MSGIDKAYVVYDAYTNKFSSFNGRNGFVDGRRYLMISYQSLKEQFTVLREKNPEVSKALDALEELLKDKDLELIG